MQHPSKKRPGCVQRRLRIEKIIAFAHDQLPIRADNLHVKHAKVQQITFARSLGSASVRTVRACMFALLLLSGCQALFPASSGHADAQPTSDARPVDGKPSDAPGCALETIEIPAEASIEIAEGADILFQRSAIRIGSSRGNVALLRFAIPDKVPNDAAFTRAEIALPRAMLAQECGTATNVCAQCSDANTHLLARWLRSDWEPMFASWKRRNATDEWEQRGALGGNDIAVETVAAAHLANNDTLITFDQPARLTLNAWVSNQRLSVRISQVSESVDTPGTMMVSVQTTCEQDRKTVLRLAWCKPS